MATGAVYYHRFYMFHAFQDFNRYVVSTCCLFLAGKAEETPKKCKDIGKIWIFDEKFCLKMATGFWVPNNLDFGSGKHHTVL